ncbi:hypothetical protein SteCoe_36166 [Stentor coeruleus]|uniref:Cyclic nucleotide-binding domain-containing protein n=1 Tax=Stentor coeruleus TaxID=5963 RepID=A0A1R2AQR0_9CILI|nr:hypothetical protein SteCoe_36166 [Stentor coeruleus]
MYIIRKTLSLGNNKNQKIHEERTLLVNRSYKDYWQRAFKKIKSQNYQKRLQNANKEVLHSQSHISDVINKIPSLNHASDIKKVSYLIIHPHSQTYLIWLGGLAISLLYMATYGAFYISFMNYDKGNIRSKLEVFIDFIVLFDFIITLNLAYFNEDNLIVEDRKMILRNYLRVSNFLEMLAAIPFGLYVYSSNTKSLSNAFYLRFIPKLIHLARLYKKMKAFLFIKTVDSFIAKHKLLVHFTRVVCLIILCLHLVSCVFYIAARIENFNQYAWTSRNGLNDAKPLEKYLASTYWTLTTLTTIGYGDITPYTSIEKAIAMIWMVLGVYILSYSVGQFTFFYSWISENDRKTNELLLLVEDIAKSTSLPSKEEKKIKVWIKRQSLITNSHQIEKILNDLHSDLRLEISLNMYEGAIQKFTYFTSKDDKFISSIAFRLIYKEYIDEDIIWKYQDYSDGIYFLINGRVKFFHKKMLFAFYNETQYFGDIDIFMKTFRKFTVMACCNCRVLIMNEECLDIIKKNFNKYYLEMKKNVLYRCHNLLINLAEMISLKIVSDKNDKKISKKFIKSICKKLYKKIYGKNDNESRTKAFKKFNKQIEVIEKTLKNTMNMLNELK